MPTPVFTHGLSLSDHPRLALGASAGTGKTYTLQALAIRNLIEGHATIGQTLMVTFTKAAAAEMRQRLVKALHEAIAQIHNLDGLDDNHFLKAAYAEADEAEYGRWVARLEQAVADVDQAVITTLDGFWAMMCNWLGIMPEGELERVDESFIARSTLNHLILKTVDYYQQDLPLAKYDDALSVIREKLNTPNAATDLTKVGIDHQSAFLGLLFLRARDWAKAIRQKSRSFTYSDVLDALHDYANPDPVANREGTGVAGDGPRRFELAYEQRRQQIDRLCGQFKVVMVDEVQDTNAEQLDLLRTLFTRDDLHLYLVGDPKQAIYEFRGGDINAWDDASAWVRSFKAASTAQPATEQGNTDQPSRVLDGVQGAGDHETGEQVAGVHDEDGSGGLDHGAVFELITNYRSDEPVIQAMNQLFAHTWFSHSAQYIPIQAAIEESRIEDIQGNALTPCALRTVALQSTAKHETVVGVINDVVHYCHQLISGDYYLKTPSDDPQQPHRRRVQAGDITVLLRRNDDIFRLNNALLSAGIPAMMASGNVLHSEAATHWLDLFNALMEKPDPQALTILVVGPWLGGSQLDAEAVWTYTLEWRQFLERYGPGALMERIDQDTQFAAKLLEHPEGRRLLTDLEHIGELLDASGEWGRRRWQIWLQRATKTINPRAEEERRRSDTDGGAIELRTSHSSKGLERPIVLVPFAWMETEMKAQFIPRLYYRQDPDNPERRQRCLNLGWDEYDMATEADQAGPVAALDGGQGEEPGIQVTRTPSGDGAGSVDGDGLAEGEQQAPQRPDMTKDDVRELINQAARHANMRLLYVEATRAKHHVAIWDQYVKHGLNTVSSLVEHSCAHVPSDVEADQQLLTHARRQGGSNFFRHASILEAHFPQLFHATQVNGEDLVAYATPQPVVMTDGQAVVTGDEGLVEMVLDARQDRITIDYDWRRSSFSGWVKEQDESDRPIFDEPDEDGADGLTFQDGVEGDPVALSVMPSGAATGTLIHKLYEVIDFQDPNHAKAIDEFLATIPTGPLSTVTPEDRAQIVDGLAQTLTTPLGGPWGRRCLADLPRTHRRDEMGYEFGVHLAGSRGLTLASLGEVWVANSREDDPFFTYAKGLTQMADDRPLRGYLLGFIDLVAQVDHPDGRNTWTVMDYKTNRVALPGVEVLRQDHYGQAALRQEMITHHYPLQSLLYQVALHRYLRASLIGYDPEVHLGGSAYLFLRGMAGAEVQEVKLQAYDEGQSGPGVVWWTPGAQLIEAIDTAFAGGVRWKA